MRNSEKRCFNVLMLLVSISLSRLCVSTKVHVTVMNRLGNQRMLNLHCRSGDDDLGYADVLDGQEFGWRFSPNIWGSTLYYCTMKWDNSRGWRHFDAYSYLWNCDRCRTECIWMINEQGLLLSYNPELENWDVVPFEDS